MIPNPILILIYKMLGHLAILSALASVVIADFVNFRNQITFGSIVVGALILVIAGIFTIRSKIADVWREEAEGERAAKERVQKELEIEKLSRSEFDREQQELRHELKDQNATLVAQLKVLEAKTDLSAALESLKEIATAQTDGHHQTHELLIEIRDKLPNPPILIKDVDKV